jgi:integrase
MASLQKKGNSFYCQFLHLGKRHTVTVGPVSLEEADAFAGKVEYLLLRIRQKLIHVPPGVAITDFILQDGKVPEPEAPPVEPITFRQLRERYLETVQNGALEENSLDTLRMHLRHFERTLGQGFLMQQLSLADLQRHVNQRARKKYRGKSLSPGTLKKEVASFRAAWNWGAHTGLVTGVFPARGLVYPKSDDKPPFQAWQEIERKLPGLRAEERAALWDCLFLQQHEVAAFLEHVRNTASLAWICPAVAFAAHTGARRSEVIRVQVQDLDLDAGTVLIREKKRAKGRRTHRRVPLSPFLAGVLREWLSGHPGGRFLFCNGAVVARSKKRSTTTGHASGKARPSSLKGRLATVRGRGSVPVSALTRDEAHDHFQRTMAGSKWEEEQACTGGWDLGHWSSEESAAHP